MKKLSITVLSSMLAVLLGVGSVVALNEYKKSDRQETTALSPAYKEKDKLMKKSDLIVTGFVPEQYTEVEVELPDEKELYEISRVYEVKVAESAKNNSNHALKKDEMIELYVPVGLKQKKSGKFLPLVEEEKIKLEAGEYLLFLKSTHSDLYGKEIYQLTTPNHIYKKNGEKYENIGSSLVPVIEARELSIE
jgi:hypothetical protein